MRELRSIARAKKEITITCSQSGIHNFSWQELTVKMEATKVPGKIFQLANVPPMISQAHLELVSELCYTVDWMTLKIIPPADLKTDTIEY